MLGFKDQTTGVEVEIGESENLSLNVKITFGWGRVLWLSRELLGTQITLPVGNRKSPYSIGSSRLTTTKRC